MAERPSALRLSDAKPPGPTAQLQTQPPPPQSQAPQLQPLLLPIGWEGCLAKKGEWLPRWEQLFVALDGVALRLFESRARYDEALALEERQLRLRHPLLSSSTSPSRRKPLAAAVARTASGTALSSSFKVQRASVAGSAAGTSGALLTSSASPSSDHRKDRHLTVTGVERESIGRAHGFCIRTVEKKPMHFAADSELERVVWVHLLQAAVDQTTKVLPKVRRKVGDVEVQVPTLAARVLLPGLHAKTLLGGAIEVNLGLFYEAWGHIQCRKGNFADLVPSLHPNVTITSNYPPSVPIAGEYHGRAGFLAFFAKLHGAIDVSHYLVQHMARSGDLAVVTGRETVKNGDSGRKFRHLWKHELRFEADGRVSHINIIADKTAAAVAFGVQSAGPSLELPHEQEPSATTCPPGEIRVVCISGERIKRKKPSPPSATLKVVIGLNNFPHLTLKPANGGSGSSNVSSKGFSHVGSWKSYATRQSKASSGANPFWAETLSIQYSGAVPGTSACLFIEVWSISVMGDDLVGCTKVNLASCLGTSAGSEEEIAASAVPRWYELRKPEYFTAGSGLSLVGQDMMGPTSGVDNGVPPTPPSSGSRSPDKCGRLQLSISFLPYTEEFNASFGEDGADDDGPTPQHRKSFDRLLALHEEAGEVEQQERATLTEQRVSTDSSELEASFEMIRREEAADEPRRRGSLGSASVASSTATIGSPDDMYTFTVASTKFRVYTRYQLIRAIGHGAYGVVIAASDQVTGNSVAIKNIPKTFDDLVDAKRIVREIRLMRHLQHPNIVTVVDVMRPPSLQAFEDTYIVTDLMETDLHRVINSPEPLSSDHIAYITYQLLCGVRYMHSAQIIHRDIKPSNVLINRDCLVKICDFGLARGIDLPDTGEPLDQALTEYVVTRWYRAPELLLASRYSTPIDVWSVGCIMVEMFTRKALFPGHDHVHQLHLILQLVGSPTTDEMGFITNMKAKRWMARQPQHERKPFETVCPGAPAAARDLMAQLLRFDPRARLSVDDAIRHPFLAAYHSEASEELAPRAFDFAFEKETRKMDKDTLRRLIFEDVCHFHPDAQDELDQFVAMQREDEERQRREAEAVDTSGSGSRAKKRAGMA